MTRLQTPGGSMRLRRHLLRALCGSLLAILPVPAIGAAEGSPRERTVAVLDSIGSAESGFELKAWLNDGAQREIAIGQELAYHFLSDREAYLTVLHVDSHGVATLLYPSPLDPDRRLVPGLQHTFPAADAGFQIRAEPPVGLEYVIALATTEPIGRGELGLGARTDPFVVVESSEAPALAERLRERFLASAPSGRASVRLEQRILGRSEASEYVTRDIVDYFTTRTRSIRRPRLDLHVHFETGSAELDAKARRNLDAVASALADPRMSRMRFQVAGHTDDVGSEEYNDGLSRERAESVVRYLREQHGLDSERLDVRFYGESRPLEPNDSDEGRRMNRRVELELDR